MTHAERRWVATSPSTFFSAASARLAQEGTRMPSRSTPGAVCVRSDDSSTTPSSVTCAALSFTPAQPLPTPPLSLR